MKKLLFWLSRKINYPVVSPQVLQVSLTYRCNLRCRMCTLVNLHPQEEELSTGQVIHLIEEAIKYKIPEILFTGGEPFLREDIFEICRYVCKRGARSVITTNGTLINERIAGQIMGLGKTHIHFSIDGLEKTNDYFRGEGAFKKAVQAIELLIKGRSNKPGISLGIACTVMNENTHELSDIVKFADEIGVDVVNFQPVAEDNARFLNEKLPLSCAKKQNIPFLIQQIKNIREYTPKHVFIYEEPHLELLIPYYENKLTRRDWICFGGFKTAFVCFEKRKPLLYSCDGICGNLDEVSLKQAWRSREAYKLRLHSKNCKNLCMQSCYSKEISQSLVNLLKFYFKNKR
ncbi:MAG: radical SAM protein [Candidatus Omnitrophota bacterium]